jgi:branched-chain amino acid transport system ATP-binding protein
MPGLDLLNVNQLTKRFGGLLANDKVDLAVRRSEIVGVIGPNGAGKTTLFNCIAGVYAPDDGDVYFQGTRITGWTPPRICRCGIARTFQVMRPFRSLTVLENVMMGAFVHTSSPGEASRTSMKVLDFTGLMEKRNEKAGALTLPDLKRLELSRALATKPTLVMLDEVMAGLTPKECEEAVDLIRQIRATGISIMMVEHVMEVIMPVSDRIVVIDNGRNLATGTPLEVSRDPRVIAAYLGE